ncbi:MAG: radical SAM family heme chaperone HemW [Pontiellaceae bacterium]
MKGLYIHIPLCISRCRYCDFYKVTPKQWNGADRFLAALDRELKSLPDSFTPDTLFIGGGTPSALSTSELEQLLSMLNERISLCQVIESTIEVNPNSIDKEKLSIFKQGGIHRVSIGVQTFQSQALRLLGRAHNRSQSIKAFELARAAGFDQINIDLIQAVPGLSDTQRMDDIDQIVKLQPDHISYYNLIYEPGTPLTRDKEEGKLCLLSDDEESVLYDEIAARLFAVGYEHYEISNFSKQNQACLHNINYWKGGEYIGCGPSAHSHWRGDRYSNIADLNAYCERLEEKQNIVDMREHLDPLPKARETLVMWLRLSEGVPRGAFASTSGITIDELYTDEIDELIGHGLLEWQQDVLRIPIKKRFISNAVYSALV